MPMDSKIKMLAEIKLLVEEYKHSWGRYYYNDNQLIDEYLRDEHYSVREKLYSRLDSLLKV